jgi:ParB/RepB/Spo0J family partition protein
MGNFKGYTFGHGSFVQLNPDMNFSRNFEILKGQKLEVISYLKKVERTNVVMVETVGDRSRSEPWQVQADWLIPFEINEENEETKMRIIETKFINITELKHHPKNHFIYGENEDISDLIESLEQFGQTRPIIVNKNNEILSGNRRTLSAKAIGMTLLECEVREFETLEEELEFLLIENVQRAKSTEQKVREAQLWKDIESAKAKARQKGKKVKAEETGTTRDAVAKRVGLGSGYNYQKAEKIVNAIDEFIKNGESFKANSLRESLNKSVNKATELLESLTTPVIEETIPEQPNETTEKTEAITTPVQKENQIHHNPNQYIFVGKASIWGINNGERIELKPNTIVHLSASDTDNPTQAIVFCPDNPDARFYVERIHLSLDSNLEVIEGLWRDRMSLALAGNPTPRTESQFLRCHELSDSQNLELSKNGLKSSISF